MLEGIVVAAAMLAATEETVAPDAAAKAAGWWQGPYATGEWFGARSEIEQTGLTPWAEYTGDYWRNTTGGLMVGEAYMHLFQFGVDWSPEPLIPGWRGAQFRFSGIQAHQTRSVTGTLVGDLNGVSNLEAPNGFRLYETWLQQSFVEGRWTVQLGNLLVDENFAATEFGALLLNGGFGWSQFMAANTRRLVPAYPFPAPGIRVEWQPTAATYLQAGVYDGDALDNEDGELSGNPDGIHFHLGGSQGFFAIAEGGYRLNQASDDTGPPGLYRLGASYQTGPFEDLYYDEYGESFAISGRPPRTFEGDVLAYLAVDQTLWREEPGADDAQGLGAFVRLGAGAADRNPFNFVVDGGLHYQGLLPGRDEDALALGCIYVAASEDLRRQERDDRDFNGAPIDHLSDYELVVELTYAAWITPWWYVQPDLQWVVHPGGSAANEDAWIIGLRTGLTF